MRKFEHNHVADTKWELYILPLCEHFQSVIGMTLANYSTVTQSWPWNDSSILKIPFKLGVFAKYQFNQTEQDRTLVAGLFPRVGISRLSKTASDYNIHKDGRSMRLFSGVRSTYLNWNSWVIPTESNKCMGKTRT